MCWNSYNAYKCDINEDKIKMNAQALVDLGLRNLGYTIVTPDCAWNAMQCDDQGKMQWNATTFPSGGAGYLQCNDYPITGSLGHEDVDA
ncbi:glycoside hydrolase family 27 protein [Lentithecium fluviatile CBS 122367]|uniref:alpha-galactosidase n=1 Tax=Lentithecium fluviatile CBS 122367 TaxID=1168545 RepID=A0A6G1J6X0_9PLEO|nr:glycoside hydrolase family 27 protein [Lentithecium fluviatile CBS 122367]